MPDSDHFRKIDIYKSLKICLFSTYFCQGREGGNLSSIKNIRNYVTNADQRPVWVGEMCNRAHSLNPLSSHDRVQFSQ
jgi:hypothetical protein